MFSASCMHCESWGVGWFVSFCFLTLVGGNRHYFCPFVSTRLSLRFIPLAQVIYTHTHTHTILKLYTNTEAIYSRRAHTHTPPILKQVSKIYSSSTSNLRTHTHPILKQVSKIYYSSTSNLHTHTHTHTHNTEAVHQYWSYILKEGPLQVSGVLSM